MDTLPLSDNDLPDAKRWNRSIHYHPALLAALPKGAQRALDVGCGEGLLARQLRATIPQVVGIDQDTASIERARRAQSEPIDYVVGDVLEYPLAPGSFDVVVSVATLHHMDASAGLRRMVELLRPGGVLGVIGLAKRSLPGDIPYYALSLLMQARMGFPKSWNHGAPMVWPPPLTFAQVCQVSSKELPGSQFRRRILGRYTLLWTKPQA
jgi:SAM-dependent methyltransferase